MSEEYLFAEECLTKKLFKRPDKGKAAELFIKSANKFKIQKNYSRAGEAFYRAAELQKGTEIQYLTSLRNSLNCYKLTDQKEMIDSIMNELIEQNIQQGKFIEAGKDLIELAEKTNSLEIWYKAIDVLQSEQHAQSHIRTCRENIAQLEIQLNNDYLKAKDQYEILGTECTQIKLLQFKAREYFLKAFICTYILDPISAEDVYNHYNTIDPSMDGSPEGDFMYEVCQEEKIEESIQKFYQRKGILDIITKQLLAKILYTEKSEKVEDENENDENDLL